jgi:hypothetical protein
MSDKIFLPYEIKSLLQSKAIVFLKEIELEHIPLGMCENCAGLGYLYAFVAEAGPFRDVPTMVDKEMVITSVTDEMYGWVWYVGKTIGGACPVCKGMKSLPAAPTPLHKFDTAQPVRELAERFHK